MRSSCSRGRLRSLVLFLSVLGPAWAMAAEAPPAADAISYASVTQRYPLPGTKRVYLQQPCDYKIIEARPDFRLLMKNAVGGGVGYLTGFGFTVLKHGQPEPLDFRQTVHQMTDGALPLLHQTVAQDGYRFEQTAFTTMDAAGRPLVMLRLKVAPIDCATRVPLKLLWQTVRQPHDRFQSHGNEDYIVFESTAPAWQTGLDLQFDGTVQHDGEIVFAAVHTSANVSITPSETQKGALECTLSWQEAAEATLDLALPYEGVRTPAGGGDNELRWQAGKAFRLAEKQQLARLSFDAEYARQISLWQARLDQATRIEVPEKLVGDVYRTLTLNNLQFLGTAPGSTACRPGQGGFNNFSVVYGWEASHFLTVMDQQGFSQETRRALDYLLTTQQGTHGPEGEISTAEGCFRPHIHWMCETGAILGIFADHARYAANPAELTSDSPALLKAARWIQGERARTRVTNADGSQVLHYGLMPPGRATDWPDTGYFFWTDAYTWRGLDKLAHAYEVAKLPDAAWLREEADDYRQCILTAVQRSLRPHPVDPTLTWVQNELYEDPTKALPTTTYGGPQSLLDAGIITADAPLVPTIEASLRQAGCLSDDFAFRMRTMEDADLKMRQEKSAGGPVDLYYVTNGERAWHRIWLERGERAKALRFFYMTLAYATSRDAHVTHERYCPQLPWLLPWQPNASGNGRVLDMILTTMAFEQGDTLQLLYGVPDAWFATGQPLGLSRLRTSWGPFSFRLLPGSKAGSYQFSYESTGKVPATIRLALPTGTAGEQRRIVEIRTEGQPKGMQEVE